MVVVVKVVVVSSTSKRVLHFNFVDAIYVVECIGGRNL